jgi:tetratricopeptide (TPR) repeat protein
MKYSIYKTIPFLFISLSLVAQKTTPHKLYYDGLSYQNERNYEKALNCFQNIVNNYPKSEFFYSDANFQIGHIYFLQIKYDEAIKVFEPILKIKVDESDSLYGKTRYESYKATELLSEIYYQKGDYEKALNYYSVLDTLESGFRLCGSASFEYNTKKAIRFSVLYRKLNQNEKAIKLLMTQVFSLFSDNSRIALELKGIILDNNLKKSDFDNALENMYAKTFVKEDYTMKQYYYKFLNCEFEVRFGIEDEYVKFDKAKIIEEIRKSSFYKMLEEL